MKRTAIFGLLLAILGLVPALEYADSANEVEGAPEVLVPHVLGAGASVPFGYPTGQELIEKISLAGSSTVSQMVETFGKENTDDFLGKLKYSGSETIDAFLLGQKELRPIGKFAIASVISSCESLDALHNPKRNWYKKLFSILRDGIDGPYNLNKNKISIFTFNYDRSLEAFLLSSIKNSYNFQNENPLTTVSAIPIIHLHGSIGTWPTPELGEYGEPLSKVALIRRSEELKLIGENESEAYTYKNIHNYISTTQRVIFLGFGYHDGLLKEILPDKRNALHCGTVKGVPPAQIEVFKKKYFQFGFNGYDMDCYEFMATRQDMLD